MAKAPLHRRAFFCVDTERLLVVCIKALPLQQGAQSAIIEPAAFASQNFEFFSQRVIIARHFLILERWAIQLCQHACPTLAQRVYVYHVLHGLAFVVGRQTFFEAISLSAAMCSIASAKSRFSLPFSDSSVRSRWASDTVIPPNLA